MERNQPQQDSCAQTCFTIASAVLSKSRVMNKAVSIPNASVTQKTKSAIEGKTLCTEQNRLTQIQQRKLVILFCNYLQELFPCYVLDLLMVVYKVM